MLRLGSWETTKDTHTQKKKKKELQFPLPSQFQAHENINNTCSELGWRSVFPPKDVNFNRSKLYWDWEFEMI